MNQETQGNVHALKHRETKPPQSSIDTPVANLFRLDGRTIIITGGGGFLGTTVAQAVLESGGDVVCLDVVPTPKQEIWASVQAAAARHGRHLSYFSCNVQNEASICKLFARIVPTLQSPIRGLVSCAGVSDNGPSSHFPADRFRRVLDINITGTFLVAQAVAQELIKSGLSGSMVLVASMSGYVSNKGVDTTAYNASKAAVHQMARSLAAEWGSRVGIPLIRVNTLSPGYIRTAISAEAIAKPGMEEQWVGDNMLLRLSTADEFRGPVLYLLGDGSSFMTGTDLRVDGGHCSW